MGHKPAEEDSGRAPPKALSCPSSLPHLTTGSIDPQRGRQKSSPSSGIRHSLNASSFFLNCLVPGKILRQVSTCWVPGPSTESSAVSSDDLFSDFHRDSTAWPGTGHLHPAAALLPEGSRVAPAVAPLFRIWVVQDAGLCYQKGPVTFSYFTLMEPPHSSVSVECHWKIPSLGISEECGALSRI